MTANRAGLQVFLYGKLAGTVCRNQQAGEIQFEYDAGYLKDDGAIALSRRLPLKDGPSARREAGMWLDGLLPEGERRVRIAAQAGVSRMSTYSMLESIGRECAGAVEIVPQGGKRNSWKIPVLEEEIEQMIDGLDMAPLGPARHAARLSLAGAQWKFGLVEEPGGEWSWPVGGYPSTHIVKPEPKRFPGLVDNEHACMEIARRSGLPAAKTRNERFGKHRVLVVARFDRTPRGERIHQEDFAQALGTRRKYQAYGGPGLREYFARSGVGGWGLWDQVMFAWLIGDEDKHAKNFSIQYPKEGGERLAPIYDAICTLVYPELERGMAWKIGNTYRVDKVTKKGLLVEARKCGLEPEEALGRARTLSERMRETSMEMEQEGWNLSPLNDAGMNERLADVCEWVK